MRYRIIIVPIVASVAVYSFQEYILKYMAKSLHFMSLAGVWAIACLALLIIWSIIAIIIAKKVNPFKQFAVSRSYGSIPHTLKKAFLCDTLDIKYFCSLSPLIKDGIDINLLVQSGNIDQTYTFIERKIIQYKHPYFFIEKLISLSIYANDLEKTKKAINQYQNVMLNQDEYKFYRAAYYCAMGLKYQDTHMHKKVEDFRFFGSCMIWPESLLKQAWEYNPNRLLLSHLDSKQAQDILNQVSDSYEKFMALSIYNPNKETNLKKAFELLPTQEAALSLQQFKDTREYKTVTDPKWICCECYVSHSKWCLVCYDCLGLNTIVWNFDHRLINPLNTTLGNRKFWLTSQI